ncbi:MAG: hypothetical protein OHK0019_18770 [Saprospiraceae bacterium]
MKNTVLLIAGLIFSASAFAQQPFQHKCSPAVSLRENGDLLQNFTLVVADITDFQDWALAENLEIVRTYSPANIVVLRTSGQIMAAKILPLPGVLFADKNTTNPREELPVPGHNLFVNKINVVQSAFPSLNGSSITISVKESRFDTADVDFKNRAKNAPNAAQEVTTHANIMASLVGGAGNSNAAGRGVASGASIVSTGFNNLLPEDEYSASGVSVQNHSYGLDIENYYGAGALAYDKSVEENPALIHVFSAGNKGLETSNSGTYANLPGFANLTGNFKMAKNVLTVGAVDSFGQVAPFSSRGPAYDGRIKPDLVAFGQDGSSGAAALVSGAAAVVQQAFFEKTDSLPSAALVRAVLLNSADDIAPPGPDFFSGFGNLNLQNAIQTIEKQGFAMDKVNDGNDWLFSLQIPVNTAEVKITLAWDDPSAIPNAPKSLVNDLDLSVIGPDGSEWKPWSLSVFPHPDSLQMPALRRRDTLNNAEQVTLDFPSPGQYTIQVKGATVRTSVQSFTLAWGWNATESFTWHFPVKNDAAVAGRDVLLRWETTFADTTSVLEYKFSDTDDWQKIDAETDLRKGWYRWPVPDTFAEAQLRMRVGDKVFESDTFLISKELRVQIGFECPDSVMLFWNDAAPVASYLLSGLGEKYLEPMQILNDTFVVLQKADFPQKRFRVTPLGKGGVLGAPSPAPDIREQGVACYFKSFLAELNENAQTDLALSIGTRYGLRAVGFEKMKDGVFTGLASWQAVDSEEFNFTDEKPFPGANHYRARLDFQNDVTLYSDTLIVFLLEEDKSLVFPNPVFQNNIQVAFKTSEEAFFLLFDMTGRLILERMLADFPQEIELPIGLPKGCYPYFFRKNEGLKTGGILLLGF